MGFLLPTIKRPPREGPIEGPLDAPGLQELKRLLGDTYTDLFVGCNAEAPRLEGLKAIQERGNGKHAT